MPSTALTLPPGAEPVPATPFVKWAGGKTSLLPELLKHVPRPVRRYHEPFVGGGALFFAVAPRRAVLSDANGELIHCWWRVTRAGRFNVPFGRYRNPTFHDPGLLLPASRALRGVQILRAPFEISLQRAAPGDFVYLDPPYDPVSETSSFTSYTRDAFTWEDQKRLAAGCAALDRRGVRFLLSNSATPRIRALYRGFEQRVVEAPRHISCKGGGRGRVEELLVFNA